MLSVPTVDELLPPSLTPILIQLLAYHISAHFGLDVDWPLSLSRCVTVK